ncbi:MAG: hypothetical protein U1F39_01775 [Steroidobacteraceae bacterium]
MRVIAEPGRFIAGPAAIGVASVMGRAEREGLWWYYLDDGLYGSWNGQMYDHASYPIESLKKSDDQRLSALAGPTCDSIDVIAENILLPKLGQETSSSGGPWAPSTAAASEFTLPVPRWFR